MTVFLLLLMPAAMLWDRDETYYARAAVEMLETGNWLVPAFNGEVFAHKPPLAYWLMAASFSVFGENEFAARFVSAPAMGISLFLTFLIGRRLFSPRAGFVAMIALGLSVMTIYLGSAAMLDAVLLASICLSAWAWAELHAGDRRFWLFGSLFGIGIALSMLAKGPVGPAVIIPLVFFSWVFSPAATRPAFRHMVGLALISIVALGIFLGWAVPANLASGGEMLRIGLGKHVIGRAFQAMEGHGGSGWKGYLASLLVYVPVILIGFFPWTITLPAALSGFWRGLIGDRQARLFVWSWLVPTFVMFTLAATKLPHYILPAFPALALMAGAVAASPETVLREKRLSFWLQTGFWLNVAFTLATIGGVLALPALTGKAIGWPLAMAFAALLLAGLALVRRVQNRAGLFTGAMAQSAATLVFFLLAFWLLVPPAEPLIKLARPLGLAIGQAAAPADAVYADGYSEPGMVFYASLPASQPIRALPGDDAALAALLEAPPAMVLIAEESRFARINDLAGTRPFAIIGQFEARNPNAGMRNQKILLAKRAAIAANNGG